MIRDFFLGYGPSWRVCFFERLFDPRVWGSVLKSINAPLRRAWLLCAVEPALWDPVCKSCALPLNTGYLFGQALASRHPLFFQWVTRERQREKELFWVEDLTWDSLVVELPPHVHLGGAITDTSKTSGIPSWIPRGLLQMDNIYFVDEIWFGTVPWQYNACYIMH